MRHLFLFPVSNCISQIDQIISLKGRFKTAKMIKSTANGPHVNLMVIRLGQDKFRSKIKRSTNSSSLNELALSLHFWNSKISQLDYFLRGKKYVQAFYVSMNHIVHMQVLYSLAKLECIVPYILFTDVLFPIFVIFNYLNSKVRKEKKLTWYKSPQSAYSITIFK
jgi:hypothetical protein